MIKKTNNRTEVIFGRRTAVLDLAIHENRSPCVTITHRDSLESIATLESSDPADASVLLVFENEAGIDALIRTLEVVRVCLREGVDPASPMIGDALTDWFVKNDQDLEKNEPDQYALRNVREPESCPVCEGSGLRVTAGSGLTCPDFCQRCNGAGSI